eukprot:2464633-Prymnesium_polylepis.1
MEARLNWTRFRTIMVTHANCTRVDSGSPSRHVLVCVTSDRSADNGQPTDSLSEVAQREGRAEHVATGGGRASPAVGRCHVP